MITQGANAINAWNSALQRDKGVGSYVQIVLQQTTDPSAPVTIFGPDNSPFGLDPNEGGAAVYGIIPAPYTNLGGVQLAADSNVSDSQLYAELTHEVGHSLGLRHNLDQGSVMWPSVNSCFESVGTLPLSSDTSWLEGSYDPEYALYRKTYTAVGCPWGSYTYDPGQTDYFGNDVPSYTLETDYIKKPIGPCPQRAYILQSQTEGQPIGHQSEIPPAARKQLIKLARQQQVAVPPTTGTRGLAGHTLPIFARSLSPQLRSNHLSPIMIHLDDHSGAAEMSLSSLYLASTLAARVVVGPTVRLFAAGPVRYAVHAARITALLRHELSPDRARQTGDVIYIADVEGAHGEPFLDDQPLQIGGTPVVFLQLAERVPGLPEGAVYRFTSPFISKMTVNAGQRLSLYNNYDSKINADLRGQAGASISSLLYAKGPSRENLEAQMITSILHARGAVAKGDILKYDATLKGDSRSITRWAQTTDEKMPSQYSW